MTERDEMENMNEQNGEGNARTEIMKQPVAYDREQLKEAHRQIASTLHKLHGVVTTLSQKENPSRYKSQITLAKRRIEAFTIADELILRELDGIADRSDQQ